MALILTRRIGQSVDIGESITVTLLDMFNAGGHNGLTARVAITAPSGIEIRRTELPRRVTDPAPQAAPHSDPVYVLSSRTRELSEWLEQVVRMNSNSLVERRMLVVVTMAEHLRGLTSFRYFPMPGTDPVLIAAAALRPGAERLTDEQMLDEVARWKKAARPCDHHIVPPTGD